MNHLEEETAIFDFCSVEIKRQVKEHLYVRYPDGALSAALCGHIPDYMIRKGDIRELRSYFSRRGTCRNCLTIYEQLRKVRYDEEHQVMKRLLNREIMAKQSI